MAPINDQARRSRAPSPLLTYVPDRLRERSPAGRVWELAGRQHGVIARWQLLALGLSREAIAHRLATGRIHRLAAGVYAVGRPDLTRDGWLMVAVLGCGPDAVVSHFCAAELWGFEKAGRTIEVSVPAGTVKRRPGITAHRRADLSGKITTIRGIPVTSPVATLVDIAPDLDHARLERAVNQADVLDLVTPEQLREELKRYRGRPGVPALSALLDRQTFRLTDSELERRFLPLVRRAELPPPQTRWRVNGYRVDFFWPELALVVETDGLRYHRTAATQAADQKRDQAHTAAGMTPLRFSHAQIRYDEDDVVLVLERVSARLIERSVHRGGQSPHDVSAA